MLVRLYVKKHNKLKLYLIKLLQPSARTLVFWTKLGRVNSTVHYLIQHYLKCVATLPQYFILVYIQLKCKCVYACDMYQNVHHHSSTKGYTCS